jgi:hypothetical protein
MAAEAVCHDILDTAESLGHQPDLGVRPRFSAPRFVGIRFLPCQEYPNHLLFYRKRCQAFAEELGVDGFAWQARVKGMAV